MLFERGIFKEYLILFCSTDIFPPDDPAEGLLQGSISYHSQDCAFAESGIDIRDLSTNLQNYVNSSKTMNIKYIHIHISAIYFCSYRKNLRLHIIICDIK